LEPSFLDSSSNSVITNTWSLWPCALCLSFFIFKQRKS
jgi:hypothetical protein